MGLDVLNLVDIRGESNYELAMRLQTSIDNEDSEFYTDLNGFQASYILHSYTVSRPQSRRRKPPWNVLSHKPPQNF